MTVILSFFVFVPDDSSAAPTAVAISPEALCLRNSWWDPESVVEWVLGLWAFGWTEQPTGHFLAFLSCERRAPLKSLRCANAAVPCVCVSSSFTQFFTKAIAMESLHIKDYSMDQIVDIHFSFIIALYRSYSFQLARSDVYQNLFDHNISLLDPMYTT